MKTILQIACATALLALSACGNSPTPAAQAPAQQQAPETTQTAQTAPTPMNPPAPAAQAPQQITDFVAQNFSGRNISFIENDVNRAGVQFEATLSDGTEIDFDANHNWDKIDCKVNPVPDKFIPQAIAAHVKANYPAAAITKIDKEPYGYEIELNNGLDLKFNPQGQLVTIDD